MIADNIRLFTYVDGNFSVSGTGFFVLMLLIIAALSLGKRS